MQGLTWFVITFAILAVFVVPAAYARKRYFAEKKPQVGVGVVVGAAALATIISVAILRSLSHDDGKRMDNVFAAMCKNPAAGDDAAKAFHDLACLSDVRVADLRGANEYQGLWVHASTRADKLHIFAPRPDLVAAPPPGKAYHLWLLNQAGDVLDHVPLDRTLSKLLLAHAKLADAVKAVITIEAVTPPPTKPSSALVVQGTFAKLGAK